MTRTHRGRITAAVALAALAAPASAAAAPSVFSSTAKIVPAGQTPTASWTQADLADETRYAVNVNGYPVTLTESNSKTTGGVINYDVLPSTYRGLFPTTRWLTEGATGAQLHTTCDVASLNTSAAALSWQGSEPVYGYIPFQATSAGVGDDPTAWLAKVKELTGVTLTESTDLNAACAGLGGTLVKPDTVLSKASVNAAGVTAPLETKIADLTKQKDDLTKAKAAADSQIKALKLEATTFTVTVPSTATLQRGLQVNVTGPPNRPVFVRALVTEKQRKELKIPVKTLGTGSGWVDEKGKAKVFVQPNPKSAPVLLRWQVAIPVTIYAISGDRIAQPIVYLGA